MAGSGEFSRNLSHDARRATDLGRFLLYCVVVGLVSGLGAITFFYLLEFSRYAFLEQFAKNRGQEK